MHRDVEKFHWKDVAGTGLSRKSVNVRAFVERVQLACHMFVYCVFSLAFNMMVSNRVASVQ